MTEVYFSRGVGYVRDGELDKAIADLSEGIRRKPKLAKGYLYRGNAYFAKNEMDPAIQDYSEVIHLSPNAAKAFFQRGRAFGVKGDCDKELADLSEAIRLDPRDDMYMSRGVAYVSKADWKNVISDQGPGERFCPTAWRSCLPA